nr:PIN domain-containing protein [Moorena bouillonii]
MLLDTSGLLCYIHRDEPQHKKAVQLVDDAGSKLLTHSHVLAELVALALIRRFPRAKVLEFVVDLVDNPDIETVWVDEQLHREAMQLLADRQDKTYSLCDAVSFILMRQRSITDALTTDRHFEQEGFLTLPALEGRGFLLPRGDLFNQAGARKNRGLLSTSVFSLRTWVPVCPTVPFQNLCLDAKREWGKPP